MYKGRQVLDPKEYILNLLYNVRFMIKIAVDAMGGDNSPKKIIDGITFIINSNKEFFIKFLVIKKKFSEIILIIN